MAWEAPGLIVSFPTTSTGLAQYRFINISTSGNLAYPAGGGAVVGVLQAGSTGSTTAPRSLPVMVSGISKVAVLAASTIGVGQIIVSSSVGSPVASTAGDYVAGRIVAGTSGSSNRVLSVLILPGGASTAL